MHLDTGLADLLHHIVTLGTGGRFQRRVEYFQLLVWDTLSLLTVAYNEQMLQNGGVDSTCGINSALDQQSWVNTLLHAD